jgi:hypothetical protein
MTAGFGTRNLYLLPDEPRALTYYDLFSAEKWTFDFTRLGFGVHESVVDDLSKFTVERIKELKENKTPDFDPQRAGESSLGLIKELILRRFSSKFASEATEKAETLLSPRAAHCWVSFGDEPAESFHAEDYEATSLDGVEKTARFEQVDFSATFAKLENGLRQFSPDANESKGTAALSLPDNAITHEPINPLEPLPILDDYIGPGGVGVRGELTNLDTVGQLAAENPVAIPLANLGENFVTLYLVISNDTPGNQGEVPLGRIANRKAAQNKLKKAGFNLVSNSAAGFEDLPNTPACEIWSRGDDHADLVHLYISMPGIEASNTPVIPDVALCLRVDGSTSPDKRTALVHKLLG